MKIFSTLTIALLIIFQTIGFAATETFSASGEYTMSDYDTPEIAEFRVLDYARRNAAEQAGIYLESYSRSVNFELEADEIKILVDDLYKKVAPDSIKHRRNVDKARKISDIFFREYASAINAIARDEIYQPL